MNAAKVLPPVNLMRSPAVPVATQSTRGPEVYGRRGTAGSEGVVMALSCVSKPRVQPRQPLLAAAAATLVLLTGLAMPAADAAAQSQGIDRSVIPVAPDAPARYVVQKGDTLWDISSRFLSDPWYWPEILYINPQVENPHLIYPGDELALI